MNYTEFFIFLKKWRQAKRYPPLSAWPREISLDGKAWEGIQKLHSLTRMDNYEYETSFFHVGGETFQTTPLRGTRDHVSASHSLQVKYDVDQKKRVYIQNVILDGKVVSRETVRPEKINNTLQAGYLFNIHTHPEHINAMQQQTYSFFSDTDIRTLMASDGLVSGLVTSSFWLVGKTDAVIKQIGEVGEELLYGISEKAFAGEHYLDEVIKANMARWGLVFYRAEFRKPLMRIN